MNVQNNNNTNHGGVGFVGLLTIVLVTLKLTNFIDWSWWWVLSPIWISFIIWLALLGLVIWGMTRK